MDTLNNIAYNIAETVNRADDNSVVERIKKLIHYYRALFIRRSMSKRDFIATQFEQTVKGLEMIRVSTIDSYDVGDHISRTKYKVPSAINLEGREAYTYVGGIDLKTNFSYIQPSRVELLKYDKFSYTIPRYYVENSYIYTPNTQPQKISIKLIAEDPTEVHNFKENKDLYPCSSDMISLIINTILSNEFKIDSSVDKDIEINDSTRSS